MEKAAHQAVPQGAGRGHHRRGAGHHGVRGGGPGGAGQGGEPAHPFRHPL